MLPFACIEHAVPGHEHPVEGQDPGGLAIAAREERRAVLDLVAGAAGRSGDDGQAGGVARHGAADGEIGVVRPHLPAGHDEELVHVGRCRHDRLGAADDDSLGVALDDVHVGVEVGLLVRLSAAVALGVGHRDAQAEVVVLDVREVGLESVAVLLAAAGVVDAGRHLRQGVQRVVRQVALGAAGFLAEQAHGFELVQEVAGRFVEVQHAVHAPAARCLHGGHQRSLGLIACEVVTDGKCVDARSQRRGIGYAVDALAVDVHHGPVAAQRFAVVVAAHEAAIGERGGGQWCVHRLVSGTSGKRS